MPARTGTRAAKLGSGRVRREADMPIHPTAIIHPDARIDESADVGPYVIIDGPVEIGPHVRVYGHAYLTGWTEIAADCQVHPFAVVGHLPQDLAHDGGVSYCRIGEGTIIREGVSIHRGTGADTETVIGKRCFLMANAHVAHNCRLEDDVKMANGAMLGGHVRVGSGAFVSGAAGVHQFVRIGELAIVGGHAKAVMDVPPFTMTDKDGRFAGLNAVGTRRAGISVAERIELKTAFRTLYRSGLPFREAVEVVAQTVETGPGQRLVAFLREPSRRGIAGAVRWPTAGWEESG